MNLNINRNGYCTYLRKSRMDIEAEKRGDGETLAKHKKMLDELSKHYGVTIKKVYKEIVSGENIAARPQMQALLDDVENEVWDGVFVVEVERLARGETKDQGIIADAFKYSNTLIVTPAKIYNPQNQGDEEFFEFGLFMSRREYNAIKRRLQSGRLYSAKSGKYIGNKPPYGYERIKLEHDSGYTLSPLPKQAEVVKMIYDWFVYGCLEENGGRRNVGTSLIARELNNRKIPTLISDQWMPSSVKNILTNEIYCGKIVIGKRKQEKKIVKGEIVAIRPRNEQYEVCNGLHESIIPDALFESAQAKFKRNKRSGERIKSFEDIKSPLAGLIVCGKCGRKMIRRPKGKRIVEDALLCPAPQCSNIGNYYAQVEESVIDSLREWLEKYRIICADNKIDNEYLAEQENALVRLATEKADQLNQFEKVCSLLEKGLYSEELFVRRSKRITESIEELDKNICAVNENIKKAHENTALVTGMIPRLENVLDAYAQAESPAKKNELLKLVVDKAVYEKNERNKRGDKKGEFKLTVFPKL